MTSRNVPIYDNVSNQRLADIVGTLSEEFREAEKKFHTARDAFKLRNIKSAKGEVFEVIVKRGKSKTLSIPLARELLPLDVLSTLEVEKEFENLQVKRLGAFSGFRSGFRSGFKAGFRRKP